MTTQKIIMGILGAAVVLGLGFIIMKPKNQIVEPINVEIPENLSTQLCFYKESITTRGLKDVTSIKMDIERDVISGEVKTLPAEKDSKVGTFEGLLVETDSSTRERTADVWWDSLAEGVRVKEELRIKMNKEADGSINSAKIGFGEMVLRADGSYEYKDKNNLTYVDVPKVDCGTLISPPAPLPPVQTPPPANTSIQFDKNIILKLHDKIIFLDGLNMTLTELADSRCPLGVQCIWAGELTGTFFLTGGKLSAPERISLRTETNKNDDVGDYSFFLISATASSMTIRVESPGRSQSPCYVGGCSGQICSDQTNISSTCEYTASYACYKTATCERQKTGQCGWTQTPALLACLANS